METHYLLQNPNFFNIPISRSNPISIASSDNPQEPEISELFENLHANILNQYIGNIIERASKEYFPMYIIQELTIQNTPIQINFCNLKSCIKITNGSELKSTYSIFSTFPETFLNCGIEISENSSGYFKNCHFCYAKQASIILKDNSNALFDHCTFYYNFVSCYLLNNSTTQFIDCKFVNDQGILILGKEDCHVKVQNCQFKSLKGKAIYCYENSEICIEKTHFVNFKKDVISIIDNSRLYITDSYVDNTTNISFNISLNSYMAATNLSIAKSFKTSIYMNNSKGYFKNCQITQYSNSPCLIVQGQNSNPIFESTKFYGENSTFSVLCHQHSRPLFYDCLFGSTLSISTFSEPHIEKCTFSIRNKKYIKFHNYSKLTYFDMKEIESSQIEMCQFFSMEKKEITQIHITTDDFNAEQLQPLSLAINQEEEEEEQNEMKKLPIKNDDLFEMMSQKISINNYIIGWLNDFEKKFEKSDTQDKIERFFTEFRSMTQTIVLYFKNRGNGPQFIDVDLSSFVHWFWYDEYERIYDGDDDYEIDSVKGRRPFVEKIELEIMGNCLSYCSVNILAYRVLHDLSFCCIFEDDFDQNEKERQINCEIIEWTSLLSNLTDTGDFVNVSAKLKNELQIE